jgi:hypothetical protein
VPDVAGVGHQLHGCRGANAIVRGDQKVAAAGDSGDADSIGVDVGRIYE